MALPSTRPSQSPANGMPAPASSDVVTHAAVRMISEAAHDLRSPLTAVRESIRLVRDGDLGPVNDNQQECLESAFVHCGCMEQMVGEMVQLERLRTGIPRVKREWTSVVETRRLVDETLMPWASPRSINVLWDGADDPSLRVFADPAMLRRLVVNLATNAIRASAESGFVLIRLAKIRQGEAVRWSIVDRGRGISEHEMMRMSRRQVSYDGGEGLGISISRQLAALQFSPLRIRSRLGKGTEASFETVTGGPRHVASAWTQWRQELALQSMAAKAMAGADVGESSRHLEVDNDRKIRLDPPAVSVALSHEGGEPRNEVDAMAGIVTVGATVSREAANQFDQLLQSQLTMFDLVYRVDTRKWVWCLDENASTIGHRVDMIGDTASARIPGIRINWTSPVSVPLGDRQSASRLSDLLVRATLSTSVSVRGFESDAVRPGTPPLASSGTAAERLDAEVARLATEMHRQAGRLRQQAKNLRPVN